MWISGFRSLQGAPTASRSTPSMVCNAAPRSGASRPVYSITSAVAVRNSMLALPLPSRSRAVGRRHGPPRSVLTWDVSRTGEGYDAAPLPRRARDVAGKMPRVLITDGLERYRIAFKRASIP